jgi:hypothetical protein
VSSSESLSSTSRENSPGSFIDTSNLSNRFFNAHQLKVVTDFKGEGLNDLISNIATPQHEGITAKHPRWPEIRQILFDMYEKQDQMIKLGFLRELKTADYLLVNDDENDKVTDVVPYTTRDIEDLVGEEAEECKVFVQKMKWTSHLDVLPNGYLDAIQCAYVEVGEQVANDDEGYEADEEDSEEEGEEEEEDILETDRDSEQRPVNVTKKRKADETFEDSVSKRAK